MGTGTSRVAALVAAAATVACAGPRGDAAGDPPLIGRLWDARTDRFVDEAAFVRALRAHRYVLLGEVHDNPAHHRLQARWVRALAREGRRPAVVFEMIPREHAAALAAALARPDATPEDVRRAVAWDASGWPDFALYAPLFAAALDAGLPVVAGDLDRREREILRREGLAGLDAATRASLALDGALPAARAATLADAIREGHCDLLPESAIAGMVAFQRARDARLARSLVDAATADGAVLVAGAGHVRRDVGVPAALARIDPGATVASVALVETSSDAAGPEAATDALRAGFGAPAPFDFAAFTARTEREDPCERLRRRLEGHTGAGR